MRDNSSRISISGTSTSLPNNVKVELNILYHTSASPPKQLLYSKLLLHLVVVESVREKRGAHEYSMKSILNDRKLYMQK